MVELQTNPEGSNTVGNSKERRQDPSVAVIHSNQEEILVQAIAEVEVQRPPRARMMGGKFGLLLWKNYILQKRHMAHFVIEVFVIPAAFIILVLLARDTTVIPFFLILTLIYPVANLCKSIVHEKERRLKESMKMMGLPNWLHWSAWMVKPCIFFGITAIPLTITYKQVERANGFPEPDYNATNYTYKHPEMTYVLAFDLTHWSVIFVFVMSYMFPSITFAFLVSSFFSKATSALTACSVLFFLPFFPTMIVIDLYYNTMQLLEKLGCCLVHNTAMWFGVVIMTRLGKERKGVQWSTIGNGPILRIPGHQPGEEYKPHIERVDEFSMLHVIVMLIVDGFLYLFLAIYLEAVFPGEYGVPLPFYFPLMPSYWRGSERSSGKVHSEVSSLDNTGCFENELEDLNAGIQIKGLKKVFGHTVAVDGLTLNFYENQVTALLGHNGSGKTTTMSMLTGLYPPSSGTALVNGFDIRKDMKSVHGSLGLCPQHDVLFDEMTVEEHLRFFCLLKGYALPVQPEINRMLIALHLEDKRKSQSKTLSGGMKRKLSVGIALIGGSKVVLLDEPTAGLDPGARRSIWDLISGEKQGRTIVLSTHFMDEADLLGDRIAILAQGKVVCCGSSLFLKQKYGAGYHLTMVKEPNCRVNVVTELLQKYIPEIMVDQNVGTELSYSLPDKKVSMFPEMFEELEKRKAELGVSGYGCSITRMEEVFIRVVEQMEAEIQSKHIGQTNLSTLPGDSQSKVPSNGELSVKSQSNATSHVMLSGESSKSNIPIPSNQEVKIKIENSPPTCNTRNTGFVLQRQQLWAMLVKKWIYTTRNKVTYIILAALPVVLYTITLYFLRSSSSTSRDPRYDLIFAPQIAFSLVFTMTFFTADFILFPIKEREMNSSHLQFVSGVPFLTFWLGHYLVDMGYYIIVCILLTIGPITIPRTSFDSPQSVLAFFLLLTLYGWAVIPMTYLLSFRYTVSSTGYTRTVFRYLILGVIASGLAPQLARLGQFYWHPFGLLALIIKFPFRFIPNYNLYQGIQKITRASTDIDLLAWGDIDPTRVNPERRPTLGIGQHLFYLFITGLICIAKILRIGVCSARLPPRIDIRVHDPAMLHDSDVAAENERIRNANLAELCMAETMVVKNLTKNYGSFLAVENVCLGVQHGECFGLLGVNGAGKTTTFKMLTGDIPISSGEAFIAGMSVESCIKDVQKVIGYCPQFDALIPELTGGETITLFARLRGISEREINGLIETLAADLLLLEHVEKPCGTYSGGNKRKLSTAIALIGSPPIVFLDEPTAGLDPVARRYLWNAIIKVREAGSSVVLTSHSMEECEALCTRLAIMVNGKFRCLGSTQHLKNKFGDGYTIIAQMQLSRVEQPERTSNQKRASLETGRRRQSLNSPPEPWEEYLQPLRNFIEKNFSECQLKDMHPCYVHYHIPMDSTSWAQMFKKMEEAKVLFLLEAYSIGQTSLEQIFLGFAKGQHNADD